ncbi:MAG: hypothetical protein Q8K64_11285 [Sediminibacterium sp.]|nr:hypothetical protein [Sediminibacterium sp.]TXT30711.1 MAG: hypothetical protein FD136_1625 [Chitinophagaceae bacterium]
MNKRFLLLITVLSIAIASTNLSAQSYKNGLGLRFGGLTNGLTVKHFMNSSSALEGILSVGRQSFIVTGLYEKHSAVDGSKRFNVFYGGGAHIGFFQNGGSYYYNSNRFYTSSTVVGLDGILGLDYKFNGAPINISMDIKPFVDFFDGNFVYFDGGLSLRYTF